MSVSHDNIFTDRFVGDCTIGRSHDSDSSERKEARDGPVAPHKYRIDFSLRIGMTRKNVAACAARRAWQGPIADLQRFIETRTCTLTKWDNTG
jgi:hypothetical protein